MLKRFRFLRRGFPLLCAATLAGCAGAGINKGDLSLISIDEEWQLGDQLAGDIAREKRLLRDPAIEEYVTRMGRTILAQATGDTPVASRPWTFHVIEDETLNAFNIPGGHVYLHSGLVAASGDYAELMGVMAHEVAHGLARHGVENLTKQYGISIVISLVLGQDPAAYQEILAQILAGGAIMKFSRGAESEADRLGVGYLYRAGIDPAGLADFFEKLLEVRGSRPGAIEQFFSSHPLTEDRIANVNALAASQPPKALTRTEPGFDAFKQAVIRAAGN